MVSGQVPREGAAPPSPGQGSPFQVFVPAADTAGCARSPPALATAMCSGPVAGWALPSASAKGAWKETVKGQEQKQRSAHGGRWVLPPTL